MSVSVDELRRLLREATQKSFDTHPTGTHGPAVDPWTAQRYLRARAKFTRTMIRELPGLLDSIEHMEADNRALRSQIGEVTRQRDNARFVADKKHQLVEALGEQVRELRAEVRRAKAERDALAMRDAAGAYHCRQDGR